MGYNDNIDKSALLTYREHGDETYINDSRTHYQHDHDRIIHSRAFRRLMHKTQIFNANKGDHYRNRLTHTLEVMQIARSIGRLLGLNQDLIEAISLGHDLGHTPFGHIGERRLNEIMNQGLADDIVPATAQGFKHNYQSLRVVDYIETRCDEYRGLNLTRAVREGIIKHTKLTMGGSKVVYLPVDLNTNDLWLEIPHSITLEGQVVAIADDIAQLTHDIEDGIRGKIISFDKFKNTTLVKTFLNANSIEASEKYTYDKQNQIIKGLVGYLINDVAKASAKIISNCTVPDFSSSQNVYTKKCIVFSSEENSIEKQALELSNNRDTWILSSQEISQSDSKAEFFISQIFKAYFKHPKELPDYILARYYNIRDINIFDRNIVDENILKGDSRFLRLICDHISGMSDQFAAREYINLYHPQYF